jgi:hypothetical protein
MGEGEEVTERKSLNPTGVQLAVCAALGIFLGLATASQHPGGGTARLIGNMVGGSLFFLIVLIAVKAVLRLGSYLVNRAKGVRNP